MAVSAKFESPINDRGFAFAVVEDGAQKGKMVFVHASSVCKHPVRKGRPMTWAFATTDQVLLEIEPGPRGLRAKSARCPDCQREEERRAMKRASWQAQTQASAAQARAEAARLGVPIDAPCPLCGWRAEHWRDQDAYKPEDYARSFDGLHGCGLRRVIAKILAITGHTDRKSVDLPGGITRSIYGVVEQAITPRGYDPLGAFLVPDSFERKGQEVYSKARLAVLAGVTALLASLDLDASCASAMVEDPNHPKWATVQAAYQAFGSARKVETRATKARADKVEADWEAHRASATEASPTSEAAQWLEHFQSQAAEWEDGSFDPMADLESKSTVSGGMVDDYSMHVFSDGSVVVVDNGTMGEDWCPEETTYASLPDAMQAYEPHPEELD
ncbi:hypothetical protein A2501_05025 [Candidatus Uhrbacteria bacterium RIFOXYC12_FULL_57_11]|nr:MAG: hypothetical protein A2501_05025 [Candidatus Uhrbacteria bacterium RIFOXYC12_FULL_57_11]